MMIDTFYIVYYNGEIKKTKPYNDNYIYRTDIKNNNLNNLKNILSNLQSNNQTIRNLVISSNNEIGNIDYNDFIKLIDTILLYNKIYINKYISTNGYLLTLSNNDKFSYIKDEFNIRITRFSYDDRTDMDFLDYLDNYNTYYNLNKAKISIELLYTKYSNKDIFIENVINIFEKYNNLVDMFIKIPQIFGRKINSLNIGTENYIQWIKDCYPFDGDEEINTYLNDLTDNCRIKHEDYSYWFYKDKKITFKKTSGIVVRFSKDLFFYGEKLIF